MLDKRTSRFLGFLTKACDDGSYKIIEKTELVKYINSRSADFTALDQLIRYLKDNEMVDVKYSDETVYCLTVLPKGRVTYESTRAKVRDLVKIDRKTLIIIIIACFIASGLGAFVGAFLSKLC